MTNKNSEFTEQSYDLREIEREVRAARAQAFRDMFSAMATAAVWAFKAPAVIWGRVIGRGASASRA